MSNTELSSTKILLEEMRTKSEIMKVHLEKMFQAHVQRTLLGERISKGIKSRGKNYYKHFNSDKAKLLLAIKEQLYEVRLALEDIKGLSLLFEMLVTTEQISLQLENAKGKTDASELIDPEGVPVRKYSFDLDQLKILEDSFEVLGIELERQFSYLNNFDLPSLLQDETIMKQYGYEFSFQGSVNVQNLGSFCDTLNSRLLTHLFNTHKKINASDIETMSMIKELKSIKLDPSVFFSPNIYDLIHKFSRKAVIDKSYEKIVFYITNFLLSRLKKNYPNEYYERIRTLLLVNDTAPSVGLNNLQSDLTCASVILESFKKLENIDKKHDESRIVSFYSKSANKIINKQVPHVGLLEDNNSIEEWHLTAKHLALLAMEVDKAYRTVYSEKQRVSYADISPYIEPKSELLRKASMQMVTRYEFLINPKGHFMSQYFLVPESSFKQKDYKVSKKKKTKSKKSVGKKR